MADPTWVRVRAVPADTSGTTAWLIECNLCGVVSLVADHESDQACLDHLKSHNVDTSSYEESQSTETP